jgi:carboxyl-terminal processing protease
MNLSRRLACTVALGSLLIAALAAAYGASDAKPVPKPDLALIANVMQYVESDYVHPVDGKQLTSDALKGMLTRLDPHSDYMTEREYLETAKEISGQFGGIGIRMSDTAGVPQVISPIDGTPAARAGLEPGDRIVAIDGHPADGVALEHTVALLRGSPGTKVTLSISRGSKPPFPVTITRARIDVPTVTSKLEPNGIGFVRISEFDANTPPAVRAAIGNLKRQAGGQLHGLVLDLRNDPGGLLKAAVAVAGDFLDGGTVVTTRGRIGVDDETYSAPGRGDLIPGTPMIVLINSGSASASEIVAGALQDRHRATLMGTSSFGKGSVQTIVPLGHDGALRLTTALYYTPSGRSIQGNGIAPDIVVSVPRSEQVANLVVFHESDLYGAFTHSTGPSAGTPPDHSPPIQPNLIGTKRDDQLKAALAYFDRTAARHRAGP